MYKVVVIGTGNVSYHICKAILKNKNLKLLQICGRKIGNSEKEFSHIKYTNDLDKLSKAEFYFICVSDDAILDVSKRIKVNNKSLIIHFSGSTDLEVLSHYPNYGVIYPLQTFSKKRDIIFSEVPLFIEGNSDFSLKKIKKISSLLSNVISVCDSKKRSFVHISAVFSNNFSNYMNLIAEELLIKEKIDPSILTPLMNETAKKLNFLSAKNAQTGPAIRNDYKTIKKHLALLKNSEYFEIYKNLSLMIKKLNK